MCLSPTHTKTEIVQYCVVKCANPKSLEISGMSMLNCLIYCAK